MQAYGTLGSEQHLRAAKNGFEMVSAQSFATGGWGPDEAFVEPDRGMLGDSLKKTHASFETPCGAYGHFKMTRYLLCATKDSRYGDSMERVLYNTILGAWPVQADGTSFYYSDYAATGKKSWHPDKWPCCSGTFPQLAADYHISTYLRSTDGVYINLFTPSCLQWTDGSGRYGLTQVTNYPLDGAVQLQISGSRPAEYTLYVRIPAWAGPNPTVSVNGRRISAVRSGAFARIGRTWKDGDRLEAEFPMPVRLEAVDAQHLNQAALLRGPLVLFAISESQPAFDKAELLRAAWGDKRAGELIAKPTEGRPVSMRPFMSIQEESYSTYVQLRS